MKKIGLFIIVMAIVCLFVGVASAEINDGHLGEALSDNIGQASSTKKPPNTGKNNLTQFHHLQDLPLTSPSHDPRKDTEFKPLKETEEPLPEPEFM